MDGKEAIGGFLWLTNLRLIFVSHAFNRLTGRFSILLPTITEVRDTSKFIAKKMDVHTTMQQYQFVVWGIPELMRSIAETKNALRDVDPQNLAQGIQSAYGAFGDGMRIQQSLELINKGFLTVQKVQDLVEMATNPLEISSLLNLAEMVLAGAEKAGEGRL